MYVCRHACIHMYIRGHVREYMNLDWLRLLEAGPCQNQDEIRTVCVCERESAYVCMYVYICVHICVCVCIHVCIYINIYIYINVYTYVYMRVCNSSLNSGV
jgi:hypothetical protein